MSADAVGACFYSENKLSFGVNDARVIGLISGKGGVGKTSLCVNLGVALNEFGSEVTLVDADFSASNLGVYLGRYDHPIKIQHVLEGRSEPQDAIFRHPTGIKAVASSNEINQVEPDTGRLQDVIREASKDSDFVLVDCPPGLNTTVESIMAACDELMIVTMPTQTAGINAAQVIERAKSMQKPVLGTIVNMTEGDPEKELVDREIEMMTESHIVGSIPFDMEMRRSIFEGEPLMLHEPLSDAALEIKQLAADMVGEDFQKPAFAGIKRKFNEIKQQVLQ